MDPNSFPNKPEIVPCTGAHWTVDRDVEVADMHIVPNALRISGQERNGGTGLTTFWPLIRTLFRNKTSVSALLRSRNYVFVRDYPPGHFYSPIPDLNELDSASNTVFDRSARQLPGIEQGEQRQLDLLAAFAGYYHAMPFSADKTHTCRYYLDNPFFSFGDGVILYSMMRHFRPKRIIEIGSGFSSAAMLDTRDANPDMSVALTFIEPRPERLQTLLRHEDERSCQIIVSPVQEVSVELFSQLEANDILFIDSSHVGKTGSDVLHLFFNVLPLLKTGVIVHVHDIPWPFEYPKNWVYGGRAYNEAYLLRAFLQFNSAFEMLYFNSFMALHHGTKLSAGLPLAMRAPTRPETDGNSSVWIRRK